MRIDGLMIGASTLASVVLVASANAMGLINLSRPAGIECQWPVPQGTADRAH